MDRRRFLALGSAAVAAPAFVPTIAHADTRTGTGSGSGTSSVGGTAAGSGSGSDTSSDSLRDLAAKVGLRFGTAVIPFDLDTPAYNAVLSEQFSVVTPGNEMKWASSNPSKGSSIGPVPTGWSRSPSRTGSSCAVTRCCGTTSCRTG